MRPAGNQRVAIGLYSTDLDSPGDGCTTATSSEYHTNIKREDLSCGVYQVLNEMSVK